MQQIDKGGGFDIGVGPTVVVVDEEFAKSMTTTTMMDDTYEITKVNPK